MLGVAIAVLALWITRPFPEGPHGYAVIRRQMPQFTSALSSQLGGTHQVTFDLAATLAFLDAHGFASVPRAALDRLNLARPERHRVEGTRRGRHVAVEVVIGPPYSLSYRSRAAHDRVGGHVFVISSAKTESRIHPYLSGVERRVATGRKLALTSPQAWSSPCQSAGEHRAFRVLETRVLMFTRRTQRMTSSRAIPTTAAPATFRANAKSIVSSESCAPRQ